MRNVVEYSLKQTVFINVVFVILIIAGAFSLFTTPLENMPNVDLAEIFIHTTYYGASADDVEKLVTQKIEDALDSLENVEYIQSRSYRNFSSVMVKLIDDTDYKDLFDEIRFRILNIKDELPVEVDEPTFLHIDTHEWLPAVVVNLTGDIPQRSLKLYAEELKSQLLSIGNVRNVEISGEYEKEFHVSIDPSKLRRYGITFNQVIQAIESAGTKIPTGRFKKGDYQFMLDAGKKLSSQEEVLNIVVRRDGVSNFIRVRDLVTSARLSHRDPSDIPSVNGENTLRLVVTKEDAGNAITVSSEVKNISAAFQESHKKDGLTVIFTNDSTIEINDTINVLGDNLILGMALVVVVLWLSLGFRNAMLTAVGIPFSFLCTLIIMKLSNVSLNTITLFSFVLVTGIIVDDAIIIMENVFRHIQMGKSKKDAVIDGTAEVMLPVFCSVLTTILAFIPMLIMSGTTGEFFSYIPKTVSFALFASLIEALFILPIHIYDWGPRSKTKKIITEDEDPFHHLRSGIFAPLWKIYFVIVRFLLNHKIFTFFMVAGLFLASLAIFLLSAFGIMPLIKVKFFTGNYFRYHVTLETSIETPIEQTDEIVRELSKFIMEMGPHRAESASGSAGFYEDQDYAIHNGNNYGQIVVTLPEKKIRDFPENPSNDPMLHLDYMRRKIKEYIEKKFPDEKIRPKIKLFEESDGPPAGKPVNIRITATTLEEAISASDRLLTYMRSTPELSDLVDLDDNRPDFHKIVKYQPIPEAAFEYGLLPGQVTAMVASCLNGYTAGKYRTVDEEIDLVVRLSRDYDAANIHKAGLADPLDVLNVPVIEHSASPIMLRDLVHITYDAEPNIRTRYKGRPTITITSDIRSGSQLSPPRVQNLIDRYFTRHKSDFFGVSLSYGGEFESTTKSYTSLSFAFAIALMGIYLVLASQFNDYYQPIIIITAVLFSLIGVIMGLFLTQTIFTVGSFMAIVGLAGISVNDSLLIIDFINRRIEWGRSLRDAVIEACAARMRPVLITTITTMLGLLPMAIGVPQKSISWAPMATAFVAGLASATILTLLIIPVEYEAFENSKIRFRRLSHKIRTFFGGRKSLKEEPEPNDSEKPPGKA